MAENSCRLYLITPAHMVLPAFADNLRAALDAGDVATVQLRMKDAPDEEVLRAAETLMPIVHRANAAFLINDRPDLAAKLRADGVHIGQDDAAYEDARAAVGQDGIVGVTCHNSRHLAIEAAERGADYIAFGAFYPTATKHVKYTADVELLRWWAEMMVVPCVAIGGITVDNARPLVEAGADFLAVSAGVWEHPDGPAAAVKAFNGLCRKHVRKD
jgi:thiamine-phosphate pyrophosphorylase